MRKRVVRINFGRKFVFFSRFLESFLIEQLVSSIDVHFLQLALSKSYAERQSEKSYEAEESQAKGPPTTRGLYLLMTLLPKREVFLLNRRIPNDACCFNAQAKNPGQCIGQVKQGLSYD